METTGSATTWPNNGTYHLDHPWEHGRWNGASVRASLASGGRANRFWFKQLYWSVCSSTRLTDGWLWDSDDIVIYEDPDDPAGPRLQPAPRHLVHVQ